MNYIYCGSHIPLLFALSLKNKGEKITVLSFSQDVIKYCADENVDYIKLKYVRPSFYSIKKIFAQKNMLDDVIKKIDCNKDDAFFLTGKGKGYDSFYLAKELSKKGCKVYYANPTEIEFKRYKSSKFKPFLRGKVIKIIIKLILNLDLKHYTGRGVPFLGIDDEFIKKYNIKDYPLDQSYDEMIVEVAKKSKCNFKRFDNLIIDQGSFQDIIKPGAIKNIYKNLLDIPVEFTFKKHPRPITKENASDLSFYQFFNNCDIVPRHIPVELLFNNIKKNIISVYSSSLITASNFKHLKSISLLELVDWCNVSFKNKVKKRLIEKSNNIILFPNSIEELKNILLNS